MPPTRERSHPRDRDRTARRAARRTELLDAAVRAIRRDGPGVSMDVIAAEAGVTKPIVYRHFGDRAGLASALAEQFGAGLIAELDDALTRDLPPDQLLRTTIDAYVGFVERDPQLYSFLVGRLGASASNELTNGIISQVGSRVALVLGEQLRALGLDSGPAEVWAYGIVGMVHLAGDWWLERQTMTRTRLVDDLTTLLWTCFVGISTNHREETS